MSFNLELKWPYLSIIFPEGKVDAKVMHLPAVLVLEYSY